MNIDGSNQNTENENLLQTTISALVESEQSYRLLAETVSDVIIKIDAASNILFVNQACERVFGYTPQEMVGKSLTLIIPDTADGIKNYLNVEEAVEASAKHKGGRIFPFEISFGESKSEHGHFFIGTGRDISKRKQSEQELLESRMVLSLAMQSSKMGVWEQEVATEIVNWSEELEEIFGIEKGGFAGTRAAYYELVHEDDRERIFDEIQTAIAEKRAYRIEFRFYHADASIRWMEGRGQAVYSEDGKPIRVYGIGIDITERADSEEQLRESEARFRGLQQATPDGFMIFESVRDASGEIFDFKWLYVNPAAEKIVGRTEADLVGKHLLEIMPGNRDEGLFDAYVNVVKTGDLWQKEFQYLHENLDHYFLTTAVKVSDGFAVAFSDITERKKIEIEREVLLEREKAARLEAEAANRAKDEFLSVLSHELRTPLNSILGWTRMMKSNLLDKSRFQQAIDTIERNARLQNNLIEDLLDVSRIISGKMLIEEEEVDFVSVVNSAIETVQTSADAKKILLEFYSETDQLKIIGDATRLQQIIVNLTNNAVKFTPENGSVSLHLSNTDDFLTLKITDTGIGISEDFLPHIFDRFRQADSTTRRNHSGLGLGLTIAGHLTELHGGEISAASDGMNKGSVFTLKLPHDFKTSSLSEVKSEQYSDASNASNEKLLEGKSILLVDDDCEGILPVLMFLEKQGAQVHCADKAQDALEKLIEQEFDLVVSDIGMPEFDGYHLISKIRESEKTAKIPAIALTAYASSEDRERALSSGFNQHLAKPVDFERLLQTILSSIIHN